MSSDHGKLDVHMLILFLSSVIISLIVIFIVYIEIRIIGVLVIFWLGNLTNDHVTSKKANKMDDETPLRKDNPVEPSHYKNGEIEPLHLIESQKLPFVEGNIIKYIARHMISGKGKNDLLKAKWYLDRLLFTEYGVGKKQ